MRAKACPWTLALILLTLSGGGDPAGATVLPVDYLLIDTPPGNNIIPGSCARISGGGLPQHTEQLSAEAWNNGPNGIDQRGGGDDVPLPGIVPEWTGLDTVYDAHSGLSSLTDSPGGEYDDNRNVSAQITQSFNLAGAGSADLSFRHHYDTEPKFDYCFVEAKAGASWNTLLTYNGTAGSFDQYLPVTLNLATYLGQQIHLRFRFFTDGSVVRDGWHVDDVRVRINGTSVFFDDFESGMGAWTLQNPWGPEAPLTEDELGTVDGNGLFTAGERTGLAHVIAAYPGAVSDTIEIKVVPPDWIPGP